MTKQAPQDTASYLELVPCNLCGQDDFSIVYNSPLRATDQENVGDFVASTDRFDRYGQIVRCRACSLVYTNPRPVPQKILEAYTGVVDSEYATEDSSRSINAHMSLHTIKRFAERGTLLDIGCATGYFLNAARLSFETQGLEPSRWAADYAKEKLRLNVHNGALEAHPFSANSFDVVTMIDVIEHFTDPLETLRIVHGLMKPSALLYLVTPDIDSFSSTVMQGKWWGLRPAHLYYFSPKTMAAMLDKLGFEVVMKRSYGRIFTYGYWLSRLKNYPWFARSLAERVIDLLDVSDKFLYLDTRDSMELCVRKKPATAKAS
jgi:2-polyprenyl-3-methyl-5-hydroxy-6-metoxy-1,4-benzoquinol methylase